MGDEINNYLVVTIILLAFMVILMMFVAPALQDVDVKTFLENDDVQSYCDDKTICFFHKSGDAGGMSCFYNVTSLLERYCVGDD